MTRLTPPFRIPALAALCVAGAALAPAAFADGFRCGSRIVVEGSTGGEVRALCGEPASIERRTILRGPVIWRHGRPIYVAGAEIEVPVETWTYNFGPNKLMRRVRLEDGLVTQIETLGYGYNEQDAPDQGRR
jgi:hypothetical protein